MLTMRGPGALCCHPMNTRLRTSVRPLLAALLLGAALAGPSPAPAATTLEGQRFEDQAQLAGSTLQLNGVGLRGVLFIKGYVAGLYVPQKATSLQALRAQNGPKRLQLRMLRAAEPDTFVDALQSGLKKNLQPAELAALQERIAQLEQGMRALGAAAVGDVIDFDYVPGTGTVLSRNGTPVKTPPIPGAELYDAVLAVFVGEHPVDKNLKQGLLGQPRS